MKKIIFVSVLAIAFLASCGGDASKSTVKYQCPMKCEGEKTYAATGTCPMCKMDLKEVK